MRFRLHFGSSTLFVGILSFLLLGFIGCTDKDTPDDESAGKGDSAVTETFDGTPYVYDMTIKIDQTVQAQGMDMGGTMEGNGTMRLTAGSKTDKGQRWQAVTAITMAGQMMGTPIDTMKQEQKMVYLVAPDGTMIDMEMSGVDSSLAKELTRMLENTSSRQSAMQMFLSSEWLQKKEGDSWEEESTDTINADDVAFGQAGMKGKVFLITRTKTRYTYQGTVDTLGMKAVRLKYELLELDLSGTMEAKELEITLASKGSGTGTYYYSVDDRLQLAGSSDLSTSSTIAIPSMSQSMPMKQHVLTTLVRKLGNK